jgi:hypothetical protein
LGCATFGRFPVGRLTLISVNNALVLRYQGKYEEVEEMNRRVSLVLFGSKRVWLALPLGHTLRSIFFRLYWAFA